MSWPVVVSKFLHDLYTSPNISQMNKSREVRWAGHVAHKGVAIRKYEVLVGNPE
jgi:hypothetical protein